MKQRIITFINKLQAVFVFTRFCVFPVDKSEDFVESIERRQQLPQPLPPLPLLTNFPIRAKKTKHVFFPANWSCRSSRYFVTLQGSVWLNIRLFEYLRHSAQMRSEATEGSLSRAPSHLLASQPADCLWRTLSPAGLVFSSVLQLAVPKPPEKIRSTFERGQWNSFGSEPRHPAHLHSHGEDDKPGRGTTHSSPSAF